MIHQIDSDGNTYVRYPNGQKVKLHDLYPPTQEYNPQNREVPPDVLKRVEEMKKRKPEERYVVR